MEATFETPETLFAWGEPTKVSYGKGSTRTVHIIMAILALLTAGGLVMLAIFGNTNGDFIPLFTIFSSLFIAAVFYLRWAILLKKQVVALYKNGLILIKGKKVRSVEWDDVKEIYQQITKVKKYGATLRTIYIYTLVSQDGTKLKVTDLFEDIKTVGNQMQFEVTNRLNAPTQKRYANGEDVHFGKVMTFNQQGITMRRKQLIWDEVEQFSLNRGFLKIHKKGKRLAWKSIPVQGVPNIIVLLNLMEYASGLKMNQKRA